MREELSLTQKAEALGITLQGAGWIRVIRPALLNEIESTTDQWVSGKRRPEDKDVSDEGLKQRVKAFKWMLSWDKNFQRLAEQVDAMNRVAAATEPATDGASPYV